MYNYNKYDTRRKKLKYFYITKDCTKANKETQTESTKNQTKLIPKPKTL